MYAKTSFKAFLAFSYISQLWHWLNVKTTLVNVNIPWEVSATVAAVAAVAVVDAVVAVVAVVAVNDDDDAEAAAAAAAAAVEPGMNWMNSWTYTFGLTEMYSPHPE